MSKPLSELVETKRLATKPRKDVLAALAFMAGDDGIGVEEIGTVAAIADCHPQTAVKHIRGLASSGLICRHPKTTKAANDFAIFVINIPAVERLPCENHHGTPVPAE